LAIPLCAVTGFATLSLLDPSPSSTAVLTAWIGGFVGLLLWLAPVIYLSSTRVSAKKITLHDITFERVAPEFTRAAVGIATSSHVPESA
jgi:hypothetical protein